jgi:hypothetical protein
MLIFPKGIVDLKGWTKEQEIKLCRISAKGQDYIALVPVIP